MILADSELNFYTEGRAGGQTNKVIRRGRFAPKKKIKETDTHQKKKQTYIFVSK